jgi:hypothetical protein
MRSKPDMDLPPPTNLHLSVRAPGRELLTRLSFRAVVGKSLKCERPYGGSPSIRCFSSRSVSLTTNCCDNGGKAVPDRLCRGQYVQGISGCPPHFETQLSFRRISPGQRPRARQEGSGKRLPNARDAIRRLADAVRVAGCGQPHPIVVAAPPPPPPPATNQRMLVETPPPAMIPEPRLPALKPGTELSLAESEALTDQEWSDSRFIANPSALPRAPKGTAPKSTPGELGDKPSTSLSQEQEVGVIWSGAP